MVRCLYLSVGSNFKITMFLILGVIVFTLSFFFIACVINYNALFTIAFSPKKGTYLYFLLAAFGLSFLSTYLLMLSGYFMPNLKYCLPFGGLTGILYSLAKIHKKTLMSVDIIHRPKHLAHKNAVNIKSHITYCLTGILIAYLIYLTVELFISHSANIK
jgi:hypothetical protein